MYFSLNSCCFCIFIVLNDSNHNDKNISAKFLFHCIFHKVQTFSPFLNTDTYLLSWSLPLYSLKNFNTWLSAFSSRTSSSAVSKITCTTFCQQNSSFLSLLSVSKVAKLCSTQTLHTYFPKIIFSCSQFQCLLQLRKSISCILGQKVRKRNREIERRKKERERKKKVKKERKEGGRKLRKEGWGQGAPTAKKQLM